MYQTLDFDMVSVPPMPTPSSHPPHPAAPDGSSATLAAFDAPLKRSLRREQLNSVRLRAFIVGSMILFGLFVFLAAMLIPGAAGAGFRPKLFALAPSLIPCIALAVIYEIIVAAIVTRWLRIDHDPRRVWSYLSSAIEVTFPTVAILAFSRHFDPITALSVTTNSFYLIFILFSVLRMDFGLCLFTGLLAGAQYAAVAAFVLHQGNVDIDADLMSSPIHHLIVALLYAASGIVAAFVSVRIRRQIAASIRHVEDRNRVVNLFGQHVSPEVVEKLLRQDVEVEGETRHVCVMFLDIRDFTPFTESREPEEVMRYLNTLFDTLIEAVNRHKGIVNKFLGDGFMAVFGAPIDDGDDCRHAVDAALEILRLLEEMNRAGSIPPTRIGIGLHSGRAVTGNVGSEARKEYTIIGQVVNVANRIEQLNKKFNSTLLMSEQVREKCLNHALAAEDLGPVPVKGQTTPVRVFKLA